jgi:predicted metal-dependent hydrolase
MTDLTVRRLRVDLETPFDRHWAGGDAFRSAWFNALSFSFPAGEQLFIDAVRMGLDRLEPPLHERFATEVRGFIGQEATHRRVHERFNAQLEAHGYVNHWQARIRHRIATQLDGLDPRAWLAVTAATEHFTAILAEYLLTEPSALAGAEPRLRDLWLWHSSEESEHRSTAFDLSRALGGNEKWRRRVYLVVSGHFATDLARQVGHHLWRDGHWKRAATWAGAWRLLLGRRGIVRRLAPAWWRYLGAGFHPSQGDGAPGRRWLAAHADLAPPVAAPVDAAAATAAAAVSSVTGTAVAPAS